MAYIISAFFYSIFYLFSLMMSYNSFNAYDFIIFLIFLFLYPFVLKFIKRKYFMADIIAALFLVLLHIHKQFDISIYCFLFLAYFVCLESYTYTHLDQLKLDNTLTKS